MNKTILILGASSDIGLALIQKIYKEYEIIIAHYYNENNQLNALKKVVGEKLYIVQADFNSEQDTEQFIKHVKDLGNPMHIVHLPATKIRNINFHKSDWNYVQEDINISLRSIYKIIGQFIKPMAKEKYGKIVFMLTSNTIITPKFMLDYTMVKYALLGFMKSLATEYADKAININAVSPSMIETKFLNNLPHMIIEKSADDNPLKRNADVMDIIPVIEFLLSDETAYITGQNIVISGGSVI